MRIDFKRLEIHNFMSYADETFDLDKNVGMNLICGKNLDIPGSKNGTGKTGLLNSICFALFGQTRNPIKNEHIRNKYIKSKEVRVVLYFDIADVKYKVASGFNKYGGAYCTLHNVTTEQEVDLTKSSILETRKFLEKEILHCDMSIFLRTMILSSDQNYNFFRLRKGEKKQFIEKLFDISVFGDMYNRIHYDINQTDKQIVSHQNRVLVLNKQHDEYEKLIAEYNTATQKQIEKLESFQEEYQNQLATIRNTKVKSNEEEVKKYEEVAEKVSNKIAELNNASLKLDKAIQKLDVKIHKLQNAKTQNEDIVNKYSEILSRLCKDCSPIMEKYFNVDESSKNIEEIDRRLVECKKLLDCNSTDKINICKQQSELQEKLDKINAKIQDLTKEFNKVNLEMTRLQAQLQNVQQQLDLEKAKENPYVPLMESNSIDLSDEQHQIDSISEKYIYLKFAEGIVSQDTLRKFIIKDLVTLLNNSIRHYLSRLGAKYYVVFDENMDYEFITDGGKYDYDNFSAGERARLMIAACFSFRDFMAIRNNLSSNILFLDEFIDGAIDAVAIDATLDILKQYNKMYNQNIYLISHRKEISNELFDNIIQIVKKDNISRVTYLAQ